MSIPTMLLFKEGEVVESLTGAISREALAGRINPHL